MYSDASFKYLQIIPGNNVPKWSIGAALKSINAGDQFSSLPTVKLWHAYAAPYEHDRRFCQGCRSRRKSKAKDFSDSWLWHWWDANFAQKMQKIGNSGTWVKAHRGTFVGGTGLQVFAATEPQGHLQCWDIGTAEVYSQLSSARAYRNWRRGNRNGGMRKIDWSLAAKVTSHIQALFWRKRDRPVPLIIALAPKAWRSRGFQASESEAVIDRCGARVLHQLWEWANVRAAKYGRVPQNQFRNNRGVECKIPKFDQSLITVVHPFHGQRRNKWGHNELCAFARAVTEWMQTYDIWLYHEHIGRNSKIQTLKHRGLNRRICVEIFQERRARGIRQPQGAGLADVRSDPGQRALST